MTPEQQNNTPEQRPVNTPFATPEVNTPPPLPVQPVINQPIETPKKRPKLLVIIAIIILTVSLLGALVWFVILPRFDSSEPLAQLGADDSMVSTLKLDTDCYTFDVPTSYVVDERSNNATCRAAVSISASDNLTMIFVQGLSGEVTSASEMLTKLEEMAESEGAKVLESGVTSINGVEAINIRYNDGNGLERTSHYVLDPSASHSNEVGDTITSYMIDAYTYNSTLKQSYMTVVDSIQLK